LRTSGASTGQTVAGALATGTHGAANQIGAMQDCVVAFHLLGQGGESLWVEAAGDPIASAAYLQRIGVSRVIRDDKVFRAAKVATGAMGLVHTVVREVEPTSLLECPIRRFDVDAVRGAIRTLDVGSLGLPEGPNLPFHFEVVINPYGTAKTQRG